MGNVGKHNHKLNRDCSTKKEHFKLYKAGKLWLVAGLATVSFGLAQAGFITPAQADTNTADSTSEATDANPVVADSSVKLKNTTTVSTSDTATSATATTSTSATSTASATSDSVTASSEAASSAVSSASEQAASAGSSVVENTKQQASSSTQSEGISAETKKS
ncbi:KxYKxGKxW signal peptide domain-containing protein [Secundilactobacillus odoratitofui]|uniref:KxYKxGKxW signal peptide domain-containing protein n=1 Tax=Secundilactobacillus odoratitofui TaxID=480930 RepID=UPI0006D04FE4|nr:KxYKxGKxW signal peptide domain-containing protein [Secundilactobacillus odoratitofui]